MRTKAIGIIVGVLLVAGLATPVSAAPPRSQWHRLNPASGTQASEHERLRCVESTHEWVCAYEKLAEPGFRLDGTTGRFHGHDVTQTWACPDWFPADACDGVTAVFEGPATYALDGGGRITVLQDYILTDVAGQPVLIQYWVGRFACPWFRTVDEALAANPDATFDCLLAPA